MALLPLPAFAFGGIFSLQLFEIAPPTFLSIARLAIAYGAGDRVGTGSRMLRIVGPGRAERTYGMACHTNPSSDEASFPLHALILQRDAPFFDEAYFLMLLLILK